MREWEDGEGEGVRGWSGRKARVGEEVGGEGR